MNIEAVEMFLFKLDVTSVAVVLLGKTSYRRQKISRNVSSPVHISRHL